MSRDSHEELIAQQCDIMGLHAEHYSAQEGKELSKTFAVQFVGEARLAVRRAAMLRGAMRDADGAWRQPKAKTPAGEAVQVWLDPDKNRRRSGVAQALVHVL